MRTWREVRNFAWHRKAERRHLSLLSSLFFRPHCMIVSIKRRMLFQDRNNRKKFNICWGLEKHFHHCFRRESWKRVRGGSYVISAEMEMGVEVLKTASHPSPRTSDVGGGALDLVLLICCWVSWKAAMFFSFCSWAILMKGSQQVLFNLLQTCHRVISTSTLSF